MRKMLCTISTYKMVQKIVSAAMDTPPKTAILMMQWKWCNGISVPAIVRICRLASMLLAPMFNQALRLWCAFGLYMMKCCICCL